METASITGINMNTISDSSPEMPSKALEISPQRSTNTKESSKVDRNKAKEFIQILLVNSFTKDFL